MFLSSLPRYTFIGLFSSFCGVSRLVGCRIIIRPCHMLISLCSLCICVSRVIMRVIISLLLLAIHPRRRSRLTVSPTLHCIVSGVGCHDTVKPHACHRRYGNQQGREHQTQAQLLGNGFHNAGSAAFTDDGCHKFAGCRSAK